MKKVISLALAAAMLLAFAGCSAITEALSGGNFEETCVELVQGNLDAVYLNKVTNSYLDLVDSTEEECTEDYLAGLEIEAEYFADYFHVDYLTDDLKDEIVELYDQIYAHSTYTVGAATQIDDDTYGVSVTISPLDIFELVLTEIDNGALDDFYNTYTDDVVASMTDEEYQAYDAEWTRSIINICYDQLPNMGTMESQTIVVQIEKDSDGYWSILDSDGSSIDELIIYYP